MNELSPKKQFLIGLAGVAFFGLVAVVLVAPTAPMNPDAWYHLSAGRWIAQHHAVPTVDTWSFTASGERWIAHEWLYQLLAFGIYSLGGFWGLFAMRLALVAVTLWMLDLVAARRGIPALLRLPVLALAAYGAAYRFADRPHMFTYLFTAVALFILEESLARNSGRAKESPKIEESNVSPLSHPGTRDLWFLVPLLWIWGNMHAGVIYGMGLIGAYGIDAAIRTFRLGAGAGSLRASARAVFLPLGVALLAPLAGPNHIWTILYPFAVLPKLREAGIQVGEFSARLGGGLDPWFLSVVVVLAIWLVFGVWRRPLRESLAVAGLGTAGLLWDRERGYVLLALSPFYLKALADLFDGLARRLREPRLRLLVRSAPGATAAIVAGILLAPLASHRLNATERVNFHKSYPRYLAEFYLENDLPENVYVTSIWSGYMGWRGGDDVKLFLDPRFDVYPAKVLRDYAAIRTSGDRAAILEAYGVQAIIEDYSEFYGMGDSPEPTGGERYRGALFDDPNWALVFWDDMGMIYVKRDIFERDYAHLTEWKEVNPNVREVAFENPNQFGLALAELGRHAESTPRSIRARRKLGYALLRARRYEDAAHNLTYVIVGGSELAADYYALAYAWDEVGDVQKALETAQAGLILSPHRAELLDLAGILLARRGELDRATHFLEMARKHGKPTLAREINLARMYDQLGQADRAAEARERATQMQTEQSAALAQGDPPA